MCVLIEDTRQKPSQHQMKHAYWTLSGVQVERSKLIVGDYMFVGGLISVDTKKNIAELAMNVEQQHERFRKELIKAQAIGVKLIILIENEDGITDLETLKKWVNPRFWINKRKGIRPPIMGGRLSKACKTMQERYGVTFEFCTPEEAGQRVLDLLKEGVKND